MRTFRMILERLSYITEINGTRAYNVTWKVLESNSYGVAQTRLRVYIIGIRRAKQQQAFRWPAQTAKVLIKDIYDKDEAGGSSGDLQEISLRR